MLFFWVYGVSIGLMAALSATPVVDSRQLWWPAAWTIAAIAFAINQLLLFLNWDINGRLRADGVDLLLTLVTPTAVLLLAVFNHAHGPRLGPLARVVLSVGTGAVTLAVWLPALSILERAV